MEFVVYVLLNEKGWIYIGQTNNIDRRLAQHNDPNRSGWASKRGLWKLIFQDVCNSRSESMRKERYLKSLKNNDRVAEYLAGWRSSTSQGS